MPGAFEEFLLWDWSKVAYRHIKDDPTRDVLDFSHAAIATDNRWNHAGEPAIYLASGPDIALAEFARHLRLDRNPLQIPHETARRVYELRVHDVQPLLDLRDAEFCDALYLQDDDGGVRWFFDMRRSRSVAAYLRHVTKARGILTPAMPALDDPNAWNLVLFLDKLPPNPLSFLTVGNSFVFGLRADQVPQRLSDSPLDYPSFKVAPGSNVVHEAGPFDPDKLDEVLAAVTAVTDSFARMTVAIDRIKDRKWHFDPGGMQTVEDVLESVAAHVSESHIQALEDMEAELPTLAEAFERLETSFNSCFGATPTEGAWNVPEAQLIRDLMWSFRRPLVQMAASLRDQAIQAVSESRNSSDLHSARTAAVAARVKELTAEVTGRTTLRLRRMVARLDDAYGTSGELL